MAVGMIAVKNSSLTNDLGDDEKKNWLYTHYSEGFNPTIDEIEQIRQKYNNPLQFMVFFTPDVTIAGGLALKHLRNIELGERYNVKKRIYFGYRHKEYLELSGFGSQTHGNDFYDLCIQNLPTFRSFINYFKIQAKDLIEKAQKEAVYLCPLSEQKNIPSPRQDFVRYDFFNKRKIVLRLTAQEAACLQSLAHGKTFKETAKLLTLSPRTVESYIRNIKNKVDCDNTSELINLFSSFTSP